jgi:HEAT repeat protein
MTAASWLCATGDAVGAEQDLKIKGKSLSRWIKDLRGANRGLQVRAARAIAAAPEEARPGIIEEIVPILKSDRENDRFVAAQILGEYGPAARVAVSGLLPMLKGTQFERNRAAAAKALGQVLKDAEPSEEVEKVTGELIVAFKDNYPDVRREAVRACGMIGPAGKACVPHLAPLCDDTQHGVGPCWDVRKEAAWTMGRMGALSKMHIDKFIAVLHRDGFRIPEIVEAMGRIGPVHENVVPNIVDAMEKAASHNWGQDLTLWPFGRAAMKALQGYGPEAKPAVSFLQRIVEKDRRYLIVMAEAARTLGTIGPAAKDALPCLAEAARFDRKYADREELKKLHEAASEAIAAIEGQMAGADTKPGTK